jgi:hypothetical protein
MVNLEPPIEAHPTHPRASIIPHPRWLKRKAGRFPKRPALPFSRQTRLLSMLVLHVRTGTWKPSVEAGGGTPRVANWGVGA